MKKIFLEVIQHACYYLEVVLSAMFIVLIAILLAKLALLSVGALSGAPEEVMNTFISQVMAIAIGVELIKLLSSQAAETVVEVLLFAITRQIVVTHGTMIDTLLGVAAIAALLAVRKYLIGNNAKPEKEPVDES